ncbi:MAG: twin-arginine translocase subunit TatC [Streptosporangiales bacterium]|nr:twin-arginine translocase subunit TatC [Streptosporangiales bacterium]
MPLMDHLRELRSRVLKAALGLVVGLVVGWLLFDPVWAFLKQPYCSLPQAQEIRPGECTLVFNGIFDAFFLHLKVALMVGAVVSAPVWLYQIWAFVVPGMYRAEKRYTVAFMGIAVPLFVLGAWLAYFAMDTALSILFSFAPEGSLPLITLSEYLGYSMAMLLVFGVSFELPLLAVFLNFIGVLTHERMKKWRRAIFFLTFVFAAVATPGGDPVTMMLMALPMIVLFAVAEAIAFLHDRRKKDDSPYAGLDDDVATPLEFPDSELDDGTTVNGSQMPDPRRDG